MDSVESRLEYHDFTDADYSLIERLFCSDKVMKWALYETFSAAEAQLFFNDILKHNADPERRAYEKVVSLNGECIGFGDLLIKEKNDRGGVAEIGYFLFPEYWGRGLGTRIAVDLIRLGFRKLHLHKIIAHCNAENIASCKVMEKCGMTREGRFRHQRYKHGKWHDELLYAIIDREGDRNDI